MAFGSIGGLRWPSVAFGGLWLSLVGILVGFGGLWWSLVDLPVLLPVINLLMNCAPCSHFVNLSGEGTKWSKF